MAGRKGRSADGQSTEAYPLIEYRSESALRSGVDGCTEF